MLTADGDKVFADRPCTLSRRSVHLRLWLPQGITRFSDLSVGCTLLPAGGAYPWAASEILIGRVCRPNRVDRLRAQFFLSFSLVTISTPPSPFLPRHSRFHRACVSRWTKPDGSRGTIICSSERWRVVPFLPRSIFRCRYVHRDTILLRFCWLKVVQIDPRLSLMSRGASTGYYFSSYR